MKTICVDFDGVVYTNMRYCAVDVLLESPVAGAKEGLAQLAKTHTVVIHSSRCAETIGLEAIQNWLALHDMSYEVVKDKPVAAVYVDDRAVCFRGDWAETVESVTAFRPWQFGAKAAARQHRRRRK